MIRLGCRLIHVDQCLDPTAIKTSGLLDPQLPSEYTQTTPNLNRPSALTGHLPAWQNHAEVKKTQSTMQSYKGWSDEARGGVERWVIINLPGKSYWVLESRWSNQPLNLNQPWTSICSKFLTVAYPLTVTKHLNVYFNTSISSSCQSTTGHVALGLRRPVAIPNLKRQHARWIEQAKRNMNKQ